MTMSILSKKFKQVSNQNRERSWRYLIRCLRFRRFKRFNTFVDCQCDYTKISEMRRLSVICMIDLRMPISLP